jgi:putative transposase
MFPRAALFWSFSVAVETDRSAARSRGNAGMAGVRTITLSLFMHARLSRERESEQSAFEDSIARRKGVPVSGPFGPPRQVRGGARPRWAASQSKNFRLSFSFYRARRTGFRPVPVISATAGEVAAWVKTERTARKLYRTRDEAKADVFDYIECFYNPKRRHSRIGYLSPMEFESKAGLA